VVAVSAGGGRWWLYLLNLLNYLFCSCNLYSISLIISSISAIT
jgi:hypothetical protein